MAIVGSAKEIIASRRASISKDGERTYERTFVVTVNSQKDDPAIALTAPGIPPRYSGYFTSTKVDLGALVTDLQVRNRSGSPYHIDVEVKYSSKREDSEEDQQENPVLRPPKIRWSFETVQVPILGTRDQRGATESYSLAVVNSAGEPFDPPPTRDESRPVCTITRFEATFSPRVAVDYQDAVNEDFFGGGIEPRQAKMRSISAEWVFENDVEVAQVTYVIAFKRDTWDIRLLNYGSHYLNSTSTTDYSRFERGGVAYLGLLDDQGLKLASTDRPTYKTISAEKLRNFSSLNLPLTR